MKEVISSSRLGESYEKIKHSSGLDILLYPMEGFQSAYALFATKYGSIDTTFKTQHDADFVTVPEGIAHFLEHKLFENEDGSDTFSLYAKTGASANAYTTFDHTAYLFGCTENFKESLEILLKFVTAPYFSPESVEKEQGIIGQEINMYLDAADWRVMGNMLEGLYQNNPVRIEIPGTIESIAQIDDTLLYRCYNTFYNLRNMVLVISGNFSTEEALAVADNILLPAEPMEIERRVPAEPAGVEQAFVTQSLAVAQPLFHIGFKHEPASERQELLGSIASDVLLEILAGEASPLYRRLYDQGLINATFYTSTLFGRGFSVLFFGGESKNPQKVYDEILLEIDRLKATGIQTADFSRVKKAAYGSYIGRYGSVNAVASMLLSSYLADVEGYEVIETVANLTIEDVERALQSNLDPSLSTLSVIQPETGSV